MVYAQASPVLWTYVWLVYAQACPVLLTYIWLVYGVSIASSYVILERGTSAILPLDVLLTGYFWVYVLEFWREREVWEVLLKYFQISPQQIVPCIFKTETTYVSHSF